jgi:S-adenosylmethionine synthetase
VRRFNQGAGDQGMMFVTLPMKLKTTCHWHLIYLLQVIARTSIQDVKIMNYYLRPDAKSQVTLEYSDDNKPTRIEAIVISTQHDDFDEEATMLAKIKKISLKFDSKNRKNPTTAHLFNDKIKYHINPTEKFVIVDLMETVV